MGVSTLEDRLRNVNGNSVSLNEKEFGCLQI